MVSGVTDCPYSTNQMTPGSGLNPESFAFDSVTLDNPMPAKDASPNMPALKALLKREYQGFELPASLR